MSKLTPPSIQKKSTSNTIRSIAFFFFSMLCLTAILSLLDHSTTTETVPLSDVIIRANDENGDIAKIVVSGDDLTITLKGQDIPTQNSRKDSSGTLYEQGLIDYCTAITESTERIACQAKYPTIEYRELLIPGVLSVILLWLSYQSLPSLSFKLHDASSSEHE